MSSDAKSSVAAAAAGGEAGAESGAPAGPVVVDTAFVTRLKAYLKSTAPALLGGSSSAFGAAIDEKEVDDTLRTYLGDPAQPALVIQKRIQTADIKLILDSKDTTATEKSETEDIYSFELQLKPLDKSKVNAMNLIASAPVSAPPATPTAATTAAAAFEKERAKQNAAASASATYTTIAYIKTVPAIDANVGFASQVHCCQLNPTAPFESILSYVQKCFLPYSRALMASSLDDADEKKDAANAASIRGVNNKLTELESELLRSQAAIDIPHITLEVHKLIAEFLKKSKADGKPTPTPEEMGAVANDTNFLNEVQRGLGEWKKQITSVTTRTRDVSLGTTIQEIDFWLKKERAIHHIYEQRESYPIEFTFQLLKKKQRYLAIFGFMPDVGLCDDGREKDAIHKYSGLLREFPIAKLTSATDLEGIIVAIDKMFAHLKNIRRIAYPLTRAIQFTHTVSRDVVTQMLTVLNPRTLMALEYESFEGQTAGCEKVFESWSAQLDSFFRECRDLQKQRPEEGDAKKLTISNWTQLFTAPYTELAALRHRIQKVRQMRKEHHELRNVISSTLATDMFFKDSTLKSIGAAYQHLRDVDVFGTVIDGKELFDAAVNAYTAKIEKVEMELEAKIREFLEKAEDANEMFRVCARFNALFIRPRISAAVHDYQEQLIATVKKDIFLLQEKFRHKYVASEARKLSKLHDLPPVSGSIIWAQQIERQLDMYMARVENVLGPRWHYHIEGKKLKSDTDQFRTRLQPLKLVQQWLKENNASKKMFEVEDRIFKIGVQNKSISLGVNFDPALVTLFKEVKHLTRLGAKLGFKLPLELKMVADEAREKYPCAMRLEEVLRTYNRTCARLEAAKELAPLAAVYKKNVQDRIAQGLKLQWDTGRLREYVDRLGTRTTEFQDHVEELITKCETIFASMQRLETCTADTATFRSILNDMQKVIDYLDNHGYSNVNKWVASLDEQVERILVKRLVVIIQQWGAALDFDYSKPIPALAGDKKVAVTVAATSGDSKEDSKDSKDEKGAASVAAAVAAAAAAAAKVEEEDEDDPKKLTAKKEAAKIQAFLHYIVREPIVHKVLIRNNLLLVEPPLQNARLSLVKELNSWMSVVCQLPRLRSFWNDGDEKSGAASAAAVKKPTGDDSTFKSIVSLVPTAELNTCFEKIEDKVSRALKYAQTWLEYQALWDMDIETVTNDLGNDMRRWEQLLLDMKRSRATFDTAASTARFGPIVIEYRTVMTKVNNKYDQWHKTILSRFGQLLGDNSVKLNGTLGNARKQLENFALDFTSTEKIVASVSLLQELNKKSKSWAVELETAGQVEKLLERQRFIFPSDWLHAERITGEWNSFSQILSRKLAKMQEEAPAIQSKIAAEDLALGRRVEDFVNDWKAKRPTRGDLEHAIVANLLMTFDAQLKKLEDEVERLGSAKKALEMSGKEELRLIPIREELTSLKELWDQLGVTWKGLDTICERKFRDFKASEHRRDVAKLVEELEKLPNHMRLTEAAEHLRTVLTQFNDATFYLTELSAGFLRPKHQKQILLIINISVAWRDLTIDLLWRADLKKHSKNVRFVLDQAQGESALEEFLADIAHKWEATKLDLVDYRQKCFLIRNWDPLFELLGSNLSDLQSMKQSPFFKAFEREALEWEDRFNKAQAIFDVFIDVQRRWVYLEGIFTNSQDVQVQLAYQYQRFKTFDKDFVRMMKEMKRENSVGVWIKEDKGLLHKLESYAETLNGIQKALGEYLEKQRLAFPRFYFVGDEDLLEIIGNAKDPIKVIRHLPKMFAGIEAIELAAGGQQIIGMSSKEGERVAFTEMVDVKKNPSIHEWLGQVEYQMRNTLATLLEEAVETQQSWDEQDRAAGSKVNKQERYFAWVDKYPAQIALLATQVSWSEQVDAILTKCGKDTTASNHPLEVLLKAVIDTLTILADRILLPGLLTDRRCKYEQLITELVHQRDVTRQLIRDVVASPSDFHWLAHMRFYFNRKKKSVLGAGDDKKGGEVPLLRRLQVRISRASFYYGFEYLGVGERLVQTPLTDRAYLTLAEAMHMRLGGNPFGPAGTGKTETVKALGSQLGRFVLVFNCDETFDFQAMGRILVGLCQCGAWGCFDEFNRLEERILSAVSQQLLTIQVGLRERAEKIALIGKDVRLNPDVGVFVTMNPGYAGRSNLPDNLKQLFRGIAMIQPNKQLIAQVMLYSQGFRTAEPLSGKVVLLFQLCQDQLSSQLHYDFGLRALKSVLRSAGGLKRATIQEIDGPVDAKTDSKGMDVKGADTKVDKPKAATPAVAKPQTEGDWLSLEQGILVKSMCSTMVPKLIQEDVALFSTLLTAVFPDATVSAPYVEALRKEMAKACKENFFLDETSWMDKCMQLYQIQNISHGVILVGPSGTGKTSAWRMLREGMQRVDGVKIVTYLIDPKAITKDELYGTLDPTTLEWTDGVFTSVLRQIVGNVRNEASKKHWIVFDGDVDPEWAENLNSVLDDNKLLTLPNGERLALTPNIRILFEVQNLNHATPATVSRCGMVWFSDGVVTTKMMNRHLLDKLRVEPIVNVQASVYNRWKRVQVDVATVLDKHFDDEETFVYRALDWCKHQEHIMEFTRTRALMSLFSLLKGQVGRIIEYNDNHPDFPMDEKRLETFVSKSLVWAVVWAFGGSMSLKNRLVFCAQIPLLTQIALPEQKDPKNPTPVIDYEVRADTSEWEQYGERVKLVDLESHKVIKPDEVIETVDTTRHTDVIGSWLADRRPLILCGPPGSGKSMTLTSVLRTLPDFELVTLNFSSSTDPELLLRTLTHYCKCDKTPNGQVMRPLAQNKWLVIFCDEINLPAEDSYKTQRVITFLRQIIEQGGFYRAHDLSFVRLERVQIIGACNPPTDAGRVVLSNRFLRHCPLLFVDFPAVPSLRQIYGTFTRALLKLTPPLRQYAEPLTEAMIEVYTASQQRFTPDQQPHYIYSPRELSRWVRALYEAIKPLDGNMSVDSLVRLWAHEALRLFQDRLVEVAERKWTDDIIDSVAVKHFPNINTDDTLVRPILFSNWMSKQYVSVEQEVLRQYVKDKLKKFYEEELDVKLVLFDEVLDHILRIDRVLRQPLGHLLLVGVSGGGKTILSKFVSWMNGMSVFQIKVHKNYGSEDFDKDLRSVLIRAGCKQEKICFIFDESNVLNTAFLERMNALLASGEVPGLFENADYTALMAECKDAARKELKVIDSEEELYKIFCTRVQRNLHVVFTMNPANEDFDNRAATSPALFNRCVIDWFGEWSSTALYQVGHEFTRTLDLGGDDKSHIAAAADVKHDVKGAKKAAAAETKLSPQRDAVVSTLVYVHESVREAMQQYAKAHGGRTTHVTPRHYLDFIKHYSTLYGDKRFQLEEQQRHLNTGLKKLRDTQEQVMTLREALQKKDVELKEKEKIANEKLEQMMIDKAAAEEKRDASIKIQAEINVQNEAIAKREKIVKNDLANAQPALEEAAAAVSSIKRDQLAQVTNMPNPPALVKLAVEPVLMMLGEKFSGWEDMRKVMKKPTFTQSILQFNIDTLNEKTRERVSTFLKNPDFTYEGVNKASKACGPLVKWVEASLNFAKIKNSVEPLTLEMKELEGKRGGLQAKMDELTKLRNELGERIEKYKAEYSVLIAETQRIKSEMSAVNVKVERSMSLLKNLSTERDRWENDSKNFQKQIATVVGDALLSAAFLAYIGYFNQTYRENLVARWSERLNEHKVPMKADLSVIEYLSTPSERLEWASNSLPSDNLCTENAIMLKRFNRYPLIIDPSGQATEYLMKQMKERKIIRTSFLDDAFLKNLESALRFGNALLVEDVESIDPVLNSVLNREITKQGGRVMITLGDKTIDFSPSFIIFLSTRDPSCHFTPDLCSRVTFVNFTVTPSSLTSQCLNQVLRAERPEIDKKRSDLLKLQGEFRVRLRVLEDSLLNALNSSQGNILDNDTVMGSLETLKKEAQDITTKIGEADHVMEEISAVSAQYRPFAVSCSAIYFSLENLSEVHFLYQFSLPFFLVVVERILFHNTDAKLREEKNPLVRLRKLTHQLFADSFRRTARGLLHEDQIAFAVRLAQISLDCGHPEAAAGDTKEKSEVPESVLGSGELDFLLRGKLDLSAKAGGAGAQLSANLKFNTSQRAYLSQLLSLPSFPKLAHHMNSNVEQWNQFVDALTGPKPEPVASGSEEKLRDYTPVGWENDKVSPTVRLFQQMLICKVLRMDLLSEVASTFVSSVFGSTFMDQSRQLDMQAMVKEESDAHTPLLLCSKPGFDPSQKVDALAAANKNVAYQSFAMGSPEGYEQADAAINKACKMGTWVLLKNVHLSPNWLVKLEKRLHRLPAHTDFRLFMTCEIHPAIPTNLIRMSNVIIFEPAVGIKSSLIRTFSTLPPERVNKAPAERSRLYFLLAWLHAVVLERLRYAPVGWTKTFEFSEADQQCAMDAIDEWVDLAAQGRANLPPSKIPWAALQTLLEQVVYGGRIDNTFDQDRLAAFVKGVFTADSYNLSFPLATLHSQDGKSGAPKALATAPDSASYDGFKKWIDAMADTTTPELLGLPGNAELMLRIAQGKHMTSELLSLQDSNHGDEEPDKTEAGSTTSVDEKGQTVSQPAWLLAIAKSVGGWQKRIPTGLKALPAGKEMETLVKNPIFRSVQREFNAWNSLLKRVGGDMNSIVAVSQAKEKATNPIRELFKVLRKDKLPKTWATPTSKEMSVPAWVEDFARRIEHMQKIATSPVAAYGSLSIWLGGFFTPEAFVAATRQAVAQAHGWSLETLYLRVSVVDEKAGPAPADTFSFTGLTLYGSSWRDNALAISNDVSTPLPITRFSWIRHTKKAEEEEADERASGEFYANVPVYLDANRQNYLFSVRLRRPANIPATVWSQRGTCLTVWQSAL